MGFADKINQYWNIGRNKEIETQDGHKIKLIDGIEGIIKKANEAEAEQRQNAKSKQKEGKDDFAKE